MATGAGCSSSSRKFSLVIQVAGRGPATTHNSSAATCSRFTKAVCSCVFHARLSCRVAVAASEANLDASLAPLTGYRKRRAMLVVQSRAAGFSARPSGVVKRHTLARHSRNMDGSGCAKSLLCLAHESCNRTGPARYGFPQRRYSLKLRTFRIVHTTCVVQCMINLKN